MPLLWKSLFRFYGFPYFAAMKSRYFALICVVLTILFTSCEDSWFKHDATMGYVIGVADNGDGTCTYTLGDKPDSKTAKATMAGECGHYKLGEGLFIPQ